jgi:hypothetical protein
MSAGAEKPSRPAPIVARGEVEELSDEELERLAEISPSDIEEAKAAFRRHAPPAFRNLLDAAPLPDPERM